MEKLNPPLVANGNVTQGLIQFDAKGKTLTYLADQDVDEVYEAFQVELKSEDVIQLNDQLVSGGDVFFFRLVGSPSAFYIAP